MQFMASVRQPAWRREDEEEGDEEKKKAHSAT
jgi:hypothetical protein